MSNKDYEEPLESERISASQLRQRITDRAIDEAKKEAEKARQQDAAKRKAYQEFIEKRFTEDDRLRIRKTAEQAADQGLFELEVLEFPSDYLNDGGRRINIGDKNWPVSLTGYAKSLYEAFLDLGQPQGYKLIARVKNYPKGLIGDIGLYLNWE